MAPPKRRTRGDPDDGPPESPSWVLAGRAFVRGRLQPVEIALSDDGRILSLGRTRRAAVRHDVGEAVILPAATDLHVHFREPGGPSGSETIPGGTTQAALGGVALVGEMPNTEPLVDTPDALEAKEALVRGRAEVDVLLYASPTRRAALETLSRRAGAFKLYLSPTTGIEAGPDAPELRARLDAVSRLGLPVSVHAEDPAGFRDPTGVDSLRGWDAARPGGAELSAIRRLEGAPPSLRLHVAHVTTPEAARAVRTNGWSFEATPHHLLLSTAARLGPWGKVNPPLRSEASRAGLWASFARGEIPILASDHAPHPAEAKDRAFELAPSGMPGVGSLLPLMLEKVRRGDLDLSTLLAAACDRPARWFGQPHGRLAPGHRAHLIVVDFRARRRVSAAVLRSGCGWTGFDGWEAVFPREVYLAGRRVVEAGEFIGGHSGRLVRPEFARGEPAGRVSEPGRP